MYENIASFLFFGGGEGGSVGRVVVWFHPEVSKFKEIDPQNERTWKTNKVTWVFWGPFFLGVRVVFDSKFGITHITHQLSLRAEKRRENPFANVASSWDFS